MFDVKGKVALVTGAASGVGLACVRELLRNELKGVAMVDIDASKGKSTLTEITKEFGEKRAIFVQTDVSSKAQLRDAFETTVSTFQQLDIVINNAGILQEIDWERCVAVNFTAVITGTILAIQTYFPKYKGGPECVIVNTASLAGLMPNGIFPTYCATKSGIVGFTRALQSDIHCLNVNARVMAVCPTFMETPIVSNLTEEMIPAQSLSTLKEMIGSMAALKPEDLAKRIMVILREASNGSVWMAMSDQFTEVTFPNYFDYKEL